VNYFWLEQHSDMKRQQYLAEAERERLARQLKPGR